ncbi:vWA domain-containing protein [Caldifermentibacillus hisashii]|uniref:vWA domain-containing protein n=1 Tax=Caldifermentibacillus hisashii TaxID=996558 RepID=UPI0031B6E4BE
MKQNKTEIIFLLDRSGSMSGLEKDTIGGFNALIQKQCQLGETILTTILFDDKYEILWNGVDAIKIKLTEKEYFVRGTTALLDAIGKTILDVSFRLGNMKDEDKPDHLLFVITTDGMENASKEFSYEKVKEMIRNQQEKHGWEFMFLGANIDVEEEAEQLGISRDQTFEFEASEKGVEAMYSMVNEKLTSMRKL